MIVAVALKESVTHDYRINLQHERPCCYFLPWINWRFHDLSCICSVRAIPRWIVMDVFVRELICDPMTVLSIKM